jgi:sulfur-carrier protein
MSLSSPTAQPIQIEVRVPGLLRDCTNNQARVPIEATTVEDAIQRLLESYPLLRVHLYDEKGAQRRHILLFYNDQNLRELARLDIPLRSGDRLSVVQAVSGGVIKQEGDLIKRIQS